jgi:hypothetical protein
MATVSSFNTPQSILLKQLMSPTHNKPTDPSSLPHAELGNQIIFSSAKNPTQLILQSAMDKINEVFAPYLGDHALERAGDSGMDFSPKATADRIMSFANHLIGRTEIEQIDLPAEEQRSREQLFNNVKLGIENGFAQSRDILESMQALHGGTKETVDQTYDYVQQGLSELSKLLGLLPPEQTNA